MAGSITVAHRIDQASPLHPALNSSGEVSPGICDGNGTSGGDINPECAFLAKIAIVATIVAADTNYQADVQAIKRYTPANFKHGVRFADVMRIGEKGRPEIDFSAFNDVVPLRAKDDDAASPVKQQDDVSAEVCF